MCVTDIINIFILGSFYGLFIGHIYEILFQDHYDRNGWWFVFKISIDPVILLANSLYFGKQLLETKYGTFALYGMVIETVIHLVHFYFIIDKSYALYKYGKRPLWYSVLFNAVDIVVIIIAIYQISYLHSVHQNVSACIIGTMEVLSMYRFSK